MRRFGLLLAVLGLAVLSFAAGSTTRRPRAGRDVARVSAKVPGLVVVCLDTLRADAVAPDAVSDGLPSLAAWARGATTFTDAIAPSTWTLPSVTSLLTGCHPTHHGIVELTSGATLPAAVPTVAKLLRDAGFTTAACTGGGWVSPDAGLGAGFDRFHVDFDRRSPSQAVVRFAREADPARPFLLFVHSYAAHDPYGDKTPMLTGPSAGADPGLSDALAEMITAKRPFDAALRRRFLGAWLGDPGQCATLSARLGFVNTSNLWLEGCRPFIDGGWRLEPSGPETVEGLRKAYRHGLTSVDHRLQDLLESLDALPEGTVVVVTGDHGEAFGEHGPLHHGRYLFHEMVHVPLVIRALGLPAGAVASGPCSLVDVAPTLLELAGVASKVPLDGESLVALAHGAARDRPSRSVVAPGDAVAGGDEVRRRRVAVRDASLAWIGTLDIRRLAWVEGRWFRRHDGLEEPLPPTVTPAPTAAFEAETRRARADLEDRYRPWRTGP